MRDSIVIAAFIATAIYLAIPTAALAQQQVTPAEPTPAQQISDLTQKLGRATYQIQTVLPQMLAEAQSQRAAALTDAEAWRQNYASTESARAAQEARAVAAEKKAADLDGKLTDADKANAELKETVAELKKQLDAAKGANAK